MPIPVWTVHAPHTGVHRFEHLGPAFAAAAQAAGIGEPAVVTNPNGERFIVLRESPFVEVSTRHINGTVRKVVEVDRT